MPDAFTIEKNVPMPSRLVGRVPKYPFGDLEVGHSFAVTATSNVEANIVRSAMRLWRLRHDPLRVFTVRKTPDGYRCWRVA